MKDGTKTIVLPNPILELLQTDDLKSFSDRFVSRNDRINRLPKAVGAFNAIATNLPDRYHWRYRSADAFNIVAASISSKGKSIKDFNRLYWRDCFGNVESYNVTSVWRMLDLVQGSIDALEKENVVGSATLARSALETAVAFSSNAQVLPNVFGQLNGVDLSQQLVASTELEEFILKTVYASRLPNTEEIYKPTNILTLINKCRKYFNLELISSEYEMLCEVTHPNYIGRCLYVTESSANAIAGDELRIIKPANGPSAFQIIGTILWTLSWSLEVLSASVHQVQGGMREIFDKNTFLSERLD